MLKLLINSLTKEFYQQHAGLFLVGLYVLFGVVEPSQLIDYQKALLLAGISSPLGMVIVFVSWFLYTAKVYFFIKQKLALAKYNFVKETTALKKWLQLKLWVKLCFTILLPIVMYVFPLIILGIKYHLFISVAGILIVFSVLTFGLSWFIYQSATFGFLKMERPPISLGVKVKKTYFSWPLFHLLYEQPLMLVTSKVLSFVFFKGIFWMFADVKNDIRVLLMALLTSILSHSVIIFTLLKFETEFLNFSKSLQLSTYKRLFNWLLVFAILLIPEWIFLITVTHFDLYVIANGFLFGLAGMFLLLTLLYIVRLNMDNYLKWLLFFFFVSMWSVLTHYYMLYSMILLGGCALCYLLIFNKVDLKTLEN